MLLPPYTVLGLIAAPALLANACALLSLNTGNRAARVVDRERHLRDRPINDPIRNREQRALLARRAYLLIRAQAAFSLAIGAFVLGALLIIAGSALGGGSWVASAVAVLALGLGGFGALAVVVGCATLVIETRLTLQSLRHDFALEFGASPSSDRAGFVAEPG